MPGPWRVLIDVPPEDLRDMEAAAPAVIPAEQHAFISEELADGSEGLSLLWVDLPAETEAEALTTADDVYLAIRDVAGLRPRGAEVVGLWPPSFVITPWRQLHNEAVRLCREGQYEWAVVRAQTSVELYAKAAFGELCRRRFGDSGPRIAKHLRSAIHDDRTTDLLQAIVGENPKTQPWWQAYDAHVARRHSIVHSGLSVTPEQAADSLQAAADCRRWLLSHWSVI
jgi:hypothetical protein